MTNDVNEERLKTQTQQDIKRPKICFETSVELEETVECVVDNQCMTQ